MTLDNVLRYLSNAYVDPEDYEGQVINEERVEFYVSRARMLIEDGVPSAISLYERKLLMDDACNQLTRISVLHELYKLKEEVQCL